MSTLLYRGSQTLILASRSPRRHDLLTRLGVEFDMCPADIDETHSPGASPEASAVEVALAKARTVATGRHSGLVLGADTIVVLDGEVLGKPRDAAAARAMLGRLTGRPHVVVTGVALVDAASGRCHTGAELTRVTMRPATAEEIAFYVESGEPMDKAGAYGAQGLGAVFIERVEGCFYNVVGLPLARLHRMLQDFDETIGSTHPRAGAPSADDGATRRGEAG